MVTRILVEHILETYSLEDILEYNDLDEADVLRHLLTNSIIEIPEPHPVDLDIEEDV